MMRCYWDRRCALAVFSLLILATSTIWSDDAKKPEEAKESTPKSQPQAKLASVEKLVEAAQPLVDRDEVDEYLIDVCPAGHVRVRTTQERQGVHFGLGEGDRHVAVRDVPWRAWMLTLAFWLPLAVTWFMMSVELPFLAAVIARLPDAKYNLAAHGVAFAFAILIEAPVIMLMSASTALVEDSVSYRKLRNFANALNAGSTLLLLAVLVPPVFDFLMRTVIGLPSEVADLTYGALWLFLPWPAAIGIRRFVQGVLIRSGRTRLVATGTLIRLAAMSATALALFLLTDLPGAWVGAASLSAAVITEAIAARLGIPHQVFDLEAAFKQDVIDDFVSEYAAGRTPIPCVACNSRFKFDALLERAQRIDPGSADIYLALAETHQARGDLSQARATAERGLLYCNGASQCGALRAYTD